MASGAYRAGDTGIAYLQITRLCFMAMIFLQTMLYEITFFVMYAIPKPNLLGIEICVSCRNHVLEWFRYELR